MIYNFINTGCDMGKKCFVPTIRKLKDEKYLYIIIGSFLYSAGITFFIFPNSLILGGTSGISVILNAYLSFSPGTILMVINVLLMILAFVVMGKGVAIKTFAGSALTTFFAGLLEAVCKISSPIIQNSFVSGMIGAMLLALAGGIMFYVGSSSGGTDIIALIINKYFCINIGKALLVTDLLIVVIGGALSGCIIAVSSMVGLLIKTFGTDLVISYIDNKTLKVFQNTH